MSDASHQDELGRLLMRLTEGQLSQSESARLESLIADDARAEQYYLSYMALHAMLRWKHEPTPSMGITDAGRISATPPPLPPIEEQASQPADPPQPNRPLRRSARWARKIDWRRHPVYFILTVAALWFGFWLFFGSAVLPWSKIGALAESSNESSATSATVARIESIDGALWGEENNELFAGDLLRPGQQLELAQGLAEIRYAKGAVVLLQAPAKLAIDSELQARLHHGALTAIVSPAGHGFTVATEATDVVDLGTEFGVRVDHRGVTDVAVFVGAVRIEPGKAIAGAKMSKRLLAGESARIAPTGAFSDTAGSGPSFVRRMPDGQEYATIFTEEFGSDGLLAAGNYPRYRVAGARAAVVDGVVRLGGMDAISDQRVVIPAEHVAGNDVLPHRLRLAARIGGGNGNAGAWHVALAVGDVKVAFHPGYPGGAIRIESLRSHDVKIDNTDLGWTPSPDVLYDVVVETRRADARQTHVRVSLADPGDASRQFVKTFTALSDDFGPFDRIELIRSGGAGGDALFDDLRVEAPPSSVDTKALETGPPTGRTSVPKKP